MRTQTEFENTGTRNDNADRRDNNAGTRTDNTARLERNQNTGKTEHGKKGRQRGQKETTMWA
jgi:hypothetical protein